MQRISRGRDDASISARVMEELGDNGLWPVVVTRITTAQLLDLIEFFFRYVSKPTKWWDHQFCGSSHPTGTYESKTARYEYTIEINRMFERFHYPYKLRKGTVVHVSSALLDARVYNTEFQTDDERIGSSKMSLSRIGWVI